MLYAKAFNEKGQSLLESTIALFAITCSVGGLWTFFIVSWTKLWLVYSCEQSLTCILQTESRYDCEKVISKRLEMLLPWSEKNFIEVACNRNSCRSKVKTISRLFPTQSENRRRIKP